MQKIFLFVGIISLLQSGAVADMDVELPFYTISHFERSNLIERARLAASAYPDGAIPEGWRTVNIEELNAISAKTFELSHCAGKDGLVSLPSGLRFRLLKSRYSRTLCLSLGGCDFEGMKLQSLGALKDIDDACNMLFRGKEDEQYQQSHELCEVILRSFVDCELEIVGHSLGGSMTIFAVARCSDTSDRVHGYTFNALGISKKMKQAIGTFQLERCNRLIVNVKDAGDPVSNGSIVGFNVGENAGRYGLVYVLGKSGQFTREMKKQDWNAHGIACLLDRMIRCDLGTDINQFGQIFEKKYGVNDD